MRGKVDVINSLVWPTVLVGQDQENEPRWKERIMKNESYVTVGRALVSGFPTPWRVSANGVNTQWFEELNDAMALAEKWAWVRGVRWEYDWTMRKESLASAVEAQL
jgi:hypothetical protein